MKKLLVFWEMKLFSFKLKNSCFLEYTFRIFYHCFFGCFHFFIFSFLPNIFECFHRCLHLFTLLFLHYWVSKHRLSSFACLNHTVFGNYMISRELYLNLSKFVHKILGANGLMNTKHIS